MDKLAARKTERAIQIVCLHHPLRASGADDLPLLDRQSIEADLFIAGADLVLAGHVHYFDAFDSLPGAPIEFTAGTACRMASSVGHSFNVFDIHPQLIRWQKYERGSREPLFHKTVAGKVGIHQLSEDATPAPG